MPLLLADGFLIPLFAGEIGIPIAGMELLNSLGAQPSPLQESVAAYQAAYRKTGAGVGAQVIDIERRLARSGLVTPPRPNSYEEYLRWSDEVVRQVASITGPEAPQGVLAAAGRGIGDLLQGVAVHIAVLALRDVAPEHALLMAHEEQLIARVAGSSQRLGALVTFPALPAALAPLVSQIAALAGMAEKFDRNTELAVQGAGLKLVLEQVGSKIRAIRAALGD